MNDEKIIRHYARLLSDVTTSENQGLSSRGVMDFYLGSSVPETQLKLYRPLLLENVSLLCLMLDDQDLKDDIMSQAEDAALGLGIDIRSFVLGRKALYEQSNDIRRSYIRLCIYAYNRMTNAEALGDEDDEDFKPDYTNNSVRVIETGFDEIYRGLR